MPRLTSRRHPLVALFRAAARGGPGSAVLLDGWHLLHEAAATGVPITHVACCGEAPTDHDAAVLRALRVRGVALADVSSDVLSAMSPVRTPSGVVALMTQPTVPEDALWQPPPALVLLACDVQDPGNLGAIVRVAEAAGATGVIAAGQSADPWHWKAVRASMGSVLRLAVVRHRDALEAAQRCRAAGASLAALTPHDGEPPDAVDLTQPVAIVVGGEGPGLDRTFLERAHLRLRIPMRPPVESLNVAVAAGIVLYEAARQRARAGGATGR